MKQKRLLIDYSGKEPKLVDPDTGEVHDVELFVMVLGASNYAFAEASLSQTVADFVASATRGLEYFGCVPEILPRTALRSWSDRYDPIINETYLDFAAHYGVSVIPARPRKPRDKAKAEATVLLVQLWILAHLLHHHSRSVKDWDCVPVSSGGVSRMSGASRATEPSSPTERSLADA